MQAKRHSRALQAGGLLAFPTSSILLNPVPCGKATGRRVSGNADGLLGDAHDATYGLIVHSHFVEDEEEGVVTYTF